MPDDFFDARLPQQCTERRQGIAIEDLEPLPAVDDFDSDDVLGGGHSAIYDMELAVRRKGETPDHGPYPSVSSWAGSGGVQNGGKVSRRCRISSQDTGMNPQQSTPTSSCWLFPGICP